MLTAVTAGGSLGKHARRVLILRSPEDAHPDARNARAPYNGSMSKVVVAMSGGVDSSVSALLLKQAGYEVVGVFMRHGINSVTPETCNTKAEDAPSQSDRPKTGPGSSARVSRQGCCSVEDAADAARVAQQLDIPFYVLNFQEAFTDLVDHFVAEYAAGRTPNPCIRCNQDIKFGRLWEYAQAIGAEAIATGHYARIQQPADDKDPTAIFSPSKISSAHDPQSPRPDSRLPLLLRGLDPQKDQSYVLFGLSREVLKHVLFPVGDYHKTAIRKIARDAGLTVGAKPDSYEICFVPDHDHARLLRERRAEVFQPGDIVDTAGRRLGRHAGLPGYTIGQRHGLKVAVGEPVYVLELRMGTNTLVVGRREELLRKNLSASGATWLVNMENAEKEVGCAWHTIEGKSEARSQESTIGNPVTQPSKLLTQNSFPARCQIRYHHRAAPCRITLPAPDRFAVTFEEPQAAITPGQAAVLYDAETGQQVLGGGWIE